MINDSDSKLESVPTQQPLEVPDIYLAELVDVVRRALQAGGLTECPWMILDDWCYEQERYLEKKYPEAHEQAEGIGTAAVDWLNSRGPVSPGLDTFIRTGYEPMSIQVNGVDMSELEPISPEEYEKIDGMLTRQIVVDGVDIPELPSVSPEFAAYRKASDELMKRMPNWFIPESPPFGEKDSALIDEMLKTGMGSADAAREGMSFSLNDSGITYTSSDGQRFVVAGNDSACTCQGFQGDNPTCAFHGEGTAWHDLHGGDK